MTGFGYVYYRFLCPSCGREYTNRLSPVLLGTGRRRCRRCGVVFDDGCREWPELTTGQKFEYFCPPTALGFVAGAIVVMLAAIWVNPDTLLEDLAIGGITLLIFGGVWAPYFFLQWSHIPKSKDRYVRRQAIGDSTDFIL